MVAASKGLVEWEACGGTQEAALKLGLTGTGGLLEAWPATFADSSYSEHVGEVDDADLAYESMDTAFVSGDDDGLGNAGNETGGWESETCVAPSPAAAAPRAADGNADVTDCR